MSFIGATRILMRCILIWRRDFLLKPVPLVPKTGPYPPYQVCVFLPSPLSSMIAAVAEGLANEIHFLKSTLWITPLGVYLYFMCTDAIVSIISLLVRIPNSWLKTTNKLYRSRNCFFFFVDFP